MSKRRAPRKMQLRDVKANLSAVVDAAVRGTPAVVTRHGKPEAVILGFDEWRRLTQVPSFGRLLMAVPVELGEGDAPRSTTPMRHVDL